MAYLRCSTTDRSFWRDRSAGIAPMPLEENLMAGSNFPSPMETVDFQFTKQNPGELITEVVQSIATSQVNRLANNDSDMELDEAMLESSEEEDPSVLKKKVVEPVHSNPRSLDLMAASCSSDTTKGCPESRRPLVILLVTRSDH